MMHRTKDNKKKNKARNRNRFGALVSALAMVAVIYYTLEFATKKSVLVYTLSNIGNDTEHRRDFIIWGVATATAFVLYLRSVYKMASFKNTTALTCLSFSGTSLTFTVLTPSNTILYPFLSKLHVFFSFAFSALMIISVSIFFTYLSKQNLANYKRPIRWMIAVVLGSILSIVIFGWCGMFELVFFVSFAIFLMALGGFIRHQSNGAIEAPEEDDEAV